MVSVPGPTRSSCIRVRRSAPDERGGSSSGLGHLVSRRSLPGMLHTWARAGSHRFPGDPSYAFALLQDPGRAGKISPWRSCRCCPRATQAEGLSGYIISRLTQGFSIRCLRFTSDVAAAHAKLASGWRAAPLPGGGRTLWIASKGFRLHPILLSRTSPVARVVYAKRPFAGPAQVLDYVGRYTHRVAISNNRLVSMDNGKVRFRWKDYRDGNRQKTMTLEAASSSAASWSMCCRTDFTASATMASLATAIARESWRCAGSCSGWCQPRRPIIHPLTTATGSRR